MECKCNKCGMGVKGLVCSKCDAALISDTIKTNDGNTVHVAKCPNNCGMIKSPMCCESDMVCSN
jgi:hypothetical protein